MSTGFFSWLKWMDRSPSTTPPNRATKPPSAMSPTTSRKTRSTTLQLRCSAAVINHQEFQVPKTECFLVTLFSAILGMGFPLHKPYPYSLYSEDSSHFRYLKCLVDQENELWKRKSMEKRMRRDIKRKALRNHLQQTNDDEIGFATAAKHVHG